MLNFIKDCWNCICPFKKYEQTKEVDSNIVFNYLIDDTNIFIYEEDPYYNVQISDI